MFSEEQEPSGRLIAVPCLQCGLSAFDALVQAKKEMIEDKLRIKDLIFWADKYEAQRDRAEAACAALFHALEMCVWRHAPYNEGLIDLQELRPYMNNLEAEALLKPNPGQRYLDLAQIVEGLPKATDIRVARCANGLWWVRYRDEAGTDTLFAKTLWKPTADVLAQLLAWRQGGGK